VEKSDNPYSKGSAVEYPPDHQAGMVVPNGGSNCRKCEYLAPDQKNCQNEYFINWEGPNKPAGSSKIPASPDRYCSDFFQAKRK
jgi:hypothetical protein